MRRNYHSIRKVKWDMKWHAMWTHSEGYETWDRVTKEEALEVEETIAKKRNG